MQYDHTQRSPLHYLLYATAIVVWTGAWLARGQLIPLLVLLVIGAMTLLVAMCFHYLRVEDGGTHLVLRYGPLPLFRKQIAYDDITAIEPSRSSVIDGWGIHWLPLRGWTYNLWGLDCAKLHVAGRIVRIGSDDVENLVAFLRSKTALSEKTALRPI